jgi:hypothetical protein
VYRARSEAMRSQEQIEREIKIVADLWNHTSTSNDVNATQNLLFGAVYYTLRWARGRREKPPAEQVIERIRRATEKS